MTLCFHRTQPCGLFSADAWATTRDQSTALACFGYGFTDEHVNAVIEAALARTDFTLLTFTKEMSDPAWTRWSVKPNTVFVTASRCSLQGTVGPGHKDLWRFERVCKEV